MRIIRPGKKNWHDEFIFICTQCQCQFVAEYGEYQRQFDQREGREWASAICPNCDNFCTSSQKYIGEQ